MTLFRIFLVALFVALFIYTLIVGATHGWNLIPPFLAEIEAMTWQGQFNLDFSGFLLISAIWCVWRNNFSPMGWVLAIPAATGGILFLAAYLLVLSVQTRGDVTTMLVGARRVDAAERA